MASLRNLHHTTSYPRQNFVVTWRRYKLVGRVVAVAFLAFVIVELGQWPAAEEHRRSLVLELASIPPVADARELYSETGSKPVSAGATKNYASLMLEADITTHYQRALEAAGWKLLAQRSSSLGLELCFGHADEFAALTVAGTSHPDWRYSLSLGWRAFDCSR